MIGPGSDKNTHLLKFFLRDMISNIGKSTHYVSCIYSEGKAIKPTNSKLVAKYAFLQAPSKLEIGWQAPGGISRTGVVLANRLAKILNSLSISSIE